MLNLILSGLGAAALLGSVAFALASLGARAARKRHLIRAGWCLAAFLALGAGNYALILLVQLPALRQTAPEAVREKQEEREAQSLVGRGDAAPPFRIETLANAPFAVEELRGKVVLINFFATWCGPCLQELPHLQRLWRENADRSDFALLVVGRGESEPTVRAFMEQHRYTFPVAADPEGRVYSLFARGGIPRTYLIAPDGVIRYAATGFRKEDGDTLRTALAGLLRSGE